MGRNINNSISKKERIRRKKEDIKINRYSNIIFLVYFVVFYLLYRNDEIILFNIKLWYYLVLYIFITFLIYLILNIPIVKRKIGNFDHWRINILASFVLSFFISILCNFGLKYLVNDLAKDQIITEHCEILEVKKGRYRRGGDYYKLKVNFKGNKETIDLDNYLFQQLEKADLNKNHAIIKVRPSIFNIYIVENVLIESKNLPK
ncbi:MULTISPECIES: hypothetical protein [Empedobacter]|uniref:hypothetical protein n=1 Tax=Empedobacter TaxID=59734 RepID=UPI0025BFEB10|nr:MULTISPECIES: hypothetical protein [unclassified Empedobacter]